MIWLFLYPLLIAGFATDNRRFKTVVFICAAIGSILAVISAGAGALLSLIGVVFVWLFTWLIGKGIKAIIRLLRKRKKQ